MWNDYQYYLRSAGLISQTYFGTGNGMSFLVSRPSFIFGMRGPNVALDTACSSSMVALNLAMSQMITNWDGTSSLVGGTQLMLLPDTFHTLNSLNALSNDGRCKTLDDEADGYGRGEAFGLLHVVYSTAVSPRTSFCFVLHLAFPQFTHSRDLDCPASSITLWSQSLYQSVYCCR